MIRVQSRFGKSVAVTSVFSLVLAMVPSFLLADTAKAVKNALPKPKPELEPSKVLSAKSLKSLQGRLGENPYAAGQSKWDVVYKGVDLMTGNFTTSGTDLTFEGGYGIPVNVTRSYSANNGEEGPLGKGWTLSVDVRSTAGGLMKSSSAPVRSVPVNFKERPSLQVDPNAVSADGAAVQPVSAVLATDSGGTEETVQRDVDGVLSTPPWDKNKIDSEYETIIKPDGTNVRIMTKNYVNTPEGTVYTYEKKGTYVGGSRPYNNPAATPEDSNVLKITSAKDRHNNITTYTYNSAPASAVSFAKSNGTTTEAPLMQISMPNGHVISFEWTGNRITKATDGVRSVIYGYTNGLLTSVTTPGGKTTTFGYGDAPTYNVSNHTIGMGVGASVITSITDPRGLTQQIKYFNVENFPWYTGGYQSSIRAAKLIHPNGNVTTYFYEGVEFEQPGTGYRLHASKLGAIDTNQNVLNSPIQHYFPLDIAWKQVGPEWVFERGSPWDAASPTTFPAGWNRSYALFGADDQNLLEERSYRNVEPTNVSGVLPAQRKLDYAQSIKAVTVSTGVYNFMGNPLSKTVSEYSNNVLTNTNTIQYSYWGGEKYYQQKAVKDQAGRYSYTDYFDKNAAQGKKGQTYKVYDGKRTTFVENTNIPIPVTVPACPTANYWKYRLEPQSDTYSAKFDYDSNGRPVDVWKIQKTDTNPWTYVQTRTTYGINTAPIWGAAVNVVEDYGGINRTTETVAYDNIGRAIRVKDASGKEFLTNYDLDGVIQSIKRVDGGLNQNVVSYTYGTSGVTNGAVLTVTDNLSGVSQAMTYFTSGFAVGQVQSVTETNGTDVYSSAYTYHPAGDRASATYTTQSALGQSNTVKWKYDDYTVVGALNSPSRAFQTVTRVDPVTDARTSEEFHYYYDGCTGALREATYAMTPQTWTPSGGASYYDSGHLAQTRGRSHYEYDASGRLKGVYNWWDTYNAGTQAYSSQFIRGNECDYESTGMKRGLKTASRYLVPVSGQPLNWQTQRQETYSYDANLDYLVGASYGDGLPNANVTWGYDAAGNRTSDSAQPGTWSYDNLNRMTASPGASYTNDILGNRLTKGSTSYSWDILNRMTGTGSTSYAYRADGLRVSKSSSTGSTKYRYDGQMGMEDVELNSSGAVTSLSRYGLGARGIDVVSRTTSSGNTVSYPLYDAHGNNVGALSKSGSSFVVSDEKSYDAWGGLRSGTNANGKAAYCANLGHKQDDESGLIYMRARYYEPTSGRFVNEDPSGDGNNWLVYARNNPTNMGDANGRVADWLHGLLGGLSGATSAAIGYILGFALMTEYLHRIMPGFNPSMNYFDQYLGVALGAISGLVTTAPKSSSWIRDANWKDVGATCGRAAAIGFATGLIFGIRAANAAFEMWYADNFDTVPW